MEKKLLRQIVICFTISGLLLASIFSVLLYIHEDRRRSKDVDIVFGQFEAVYEQSEERMLKRRDLYETDYVTRGKAIDYFLKQNPDRAIPYVLQELCQKLSVSQIHLLDEEGRIAVSSLHGASGSRLIDSEEGNSIREVIAGREPDNWMLLDSKNIFDHIVARHYAVVKSSMEEYPVILVGISESVISRVRESIDIENVLASVPAMQDQVLMVIDKNTGQVLGGSREEYNGIQLEEKDMKKVSSASSRKSVRIFGERTFIKSREYRDMFLVSFQLFDNGIRLVLMEIASCVVLLALAFVLLVAVIRRYFQNYIFNEFKMIEKTIEDVLTGKNAQFYTSQDTEVRKLVESLNRFMNRNIELTQQVRTSDIDTVTGLVNRSGFEKYIAGFMKQSEKHGVMLMMDMDNFKSINDNLGHPEGDRILKIAADCLRKVFRENDTIVRMGGDEFAVFLETAIPKERLKEKAEQVIRSLREAVPEYYQKYNVSISIGIAIFPKGLTDFNKLYKCADEALYDAKRKGKDRYMIRICNEEEMADTGKTGEGTAI